MAAELSHGALVVGVAGGLARGGHGRRAAAAEHGAVRPGSVHCHHEVLWPHQDLRAFLPSVTEHLYKKALHTTSTQY